MSILKNGEIVDRTQAFSNFDGPHIKCFDSFDTVNDILEIKNGGHDGVLIFVKLINNGTFIGLTPYYAAFKACNFRWGIYNDSGLH